MKRNLLTFFFLMACLVKVTAQTDKDLKAVSELISDQKTANSKDLLSTFFRAGLENILGDDRSFTLNSTFYGIDSVFRKKGSIRDYKTERLLRQSTFNIGLTGDSTNSITKITGGFTFTLINQTDLKQTPMSNPDFNTILTMQHIMAALIKEIKKDIAIKHKDEFLNKNPKDTKPNDLNKEITKFLADAAKKHDFTGLHPYIIESLNDPQLLVKVMADPNIINKVNSIELQTIIKNTLDGKDVLHEAYTQIAEKYARKPIWTLSPTGTYDRIDKQGEFALMSNFTVGLGNNPARKPWELEIKSKFTFSNDTTVNQTTNYNNKPFTASIGVNKVLLQNEAKESKMEFKFFTQYDRQFGSADQITDKELFTLNSTLRVNIFKSLWLPVTIKYDPKNANVFGYFSITANLDN